MSEHESIKKPVPYSRSVETRSDDEEQTIAEIMTTMRRIQETTFADGGHAIRSVHAKSHGLLNATLDVSEGLPPELAQGLFAKPARYSVVMRFSAIPGDLLHDKVSAPRGLSIKVVGVEGERLEGADGATTQDFVMINGPTFLAPDAKKFLATQKKLAATTDKVSGAKEAFSAVLQVVEKGLEAIGGESATLKSLGGHPETNVLGETYYSQTAFRYGNYIAKFSIVPSSAALKALTDAKVDLDNKPDGLRDAVVEFFASQGGEWEFRVQLCMSLESMPVEDPSVPWDEKESPYRTVARLSAGAQAAWTVERARRVDDGMLFAPWHGLAAHQPLGQINRARRRPYVESARFREEHNHLPIEEPAVDTVLP